MVCRPFLAFVTILVLSSSLSVQANDWTSRVIRFQSSDLEGPPPVVSGLSAWSEGNVIASVGDDHVVRLWHLVSGEPMGALKGHEDWVRSVAFSPNRDEIATGGNDRKVILWDLASREVIHRLPLGFAVVDLAFSPDGRQLAAAGHSDQLALVSLESELPVVWLTCPCKDMLALAFSPDGRLLAAGGRNGMIQIWDLKTRQVIDSSTSHGGRVLSLAFTDDGERLVSCGDDRRVCVRRRTGNDWETRSLPTRTAKYLAFTLLDNQIVVGGTDNKIRVWELDTFREVVVLAGHSGSVSALQATEDGFISGSFDTTMRIWTRTKRVSAE
jgi:WD40 repeat protein